MNLSAFLSVIDGGEVVRIVNYNSRVILYEGKKVDCPFFDVAVVGVWSLWTMGGKIIIEVA